MKRKNSKQIGNSSKTNINKHAINSNFNIQRNHDFIAKYGITNTKIVVFHL
jgi:hypothetical protein